MVGCLGACFGRAKDSNKRDGDTKFPLHFSEAQVCDYFVDRLPSRLQGDGLHLLRAGPGPIVQGWTHELLDEAGVHSYQDREMLLKIRDQMTVAVDTHRQRRRLAGVSTSGKGACSPPLDGDAHCQGQAMADGGVRRRSLPGKEGREDFQAQGHGVSGAAATHAAAAADVSVADVKVAAAAAAAAAAANAAAGLGPDGKPFHLTSDWLNAPISLYRISEDRAESMRHMASSGALDPSVRQRPPSAQRREAAAAADGGCGAAADGPGGPSSGFQKSRFGPSSCAAGLAFPVDCADGDLVGSGGIGGLDSSSSPSSSSCEVGNVCAEGASPSPSSASAAEGASTERPRAGGASSQSAHPGQEDAVTAVAAEAGVEAAGGGGADGAADQPGAVGPSSKRLPPLAAAAAALPALSKASKDVCSMRDVAPGPAGLAGASGADAGCGGAGGGGGKPIVHADEEDGSSGDSGAEDSDADRLAAITALAAAGS